MAQALRAMEEMSGDIEKILSRFGLSYLQYVLSPARLALLRVVIADASRFPGLARKFYQAGPKVIAEMIAQQLARAARAKEIDVQAVGIENAATLFISLLRGEGQLECLTHPHATPSAEQLDRWVKQAVTTFLAAFVRQGFSGTRCNALHILQTIRYQMLQFLSAQGLSPEPSL